jgi:hypothetical protein
LWTKGLNAKNIHKETFLVYGGNCFSLKGVHNWVEKFSQGRLKVADYEAELRKWPRQQSKTCVLRISPADKAMGNSISVGTEICREVMLL